MRRLLGLAILLIAFVVIFRLHDSRQPNRTHVLDYPFPVGFYEVTFGYLKQIAAQVLYVKMNVFLGETSIKEDDFADPLVANCDVVSSLNPVFAAPYFTCQSRLSHISPEYTYKMNALLDRGIEREIGEPYLSFFKGVNLFYYLDDNIGASKVFEDVATKYESAKPLAHLASVLRGKDGDLRGGYLTLRNLIQNEEDERTLERYNAELSDYELAIMMSNLIDQYNLEKGRYPKVLTELVPGYIDTLPELNYFQFEWVSPKLKLIRP
jgi:hypothetical protein